jgi:hypothetical protein
MVRGARTLVGHRGSKTGGRQNVRGSKDEPWDPASPDDDALRDLRVHDDDSQDPVNDEYIWPQFDEEEDD